jgi:predicted dehydrogenase
MADRIRIIIVGCGNMGSSHARAYHKMNDFEVVGVVDHGETNRVRLAAELGGVTQFDNFDSAMAATRPDAVCIATYPDTHAPFALQALNAGCHVFIEKPLAFTVSDAEAVASLALAKNLKVVVGYILRVHPAWQKFIEIARTLGKPLVMRLNLNQQSSGDAWLGHKHLMESMSPIVDCGVHYVDVMCQMTDAKPVKVYAIGARLTNEIMPEMYNYGQLQISFDDGSVGWYEAGWGPMMSETAFFVKDIIGPLGSVSIVTGEGYGTSADISSHTKTNQLRVHHARLDASGHFAQPDEILDMSDEPDHQALCDREQAYFLRSIRENLDLSDHLKDAVNSLRIVLAADRSYRTGTVVDL